MAAIEPTRKTPYYQKARQRSTPRELCEALVRYYYDCGAPFGEHGACIWLFFDQQTTRN